jgi:hypothetical protein
MVYGQPDQILSFFDPSLTQRQRHAYKTRRGINNIDSGGCSFSIGNATREMLLPRRRTTMMIQMTKVAVAATMLLRLFMVVPFTYAQQPLPPPANQDDNECFQTIASLQSVMATELSRIANGAVPAAAYTFILCPNTFLDASAMPLTPLLDKSTFMCGNDGHVRNRCIIVGGGGGGGGSNGTATAPGTTIVTDAQVRIVDSTTPGHVLQQVDFVGVTFSGFESNVHTKMGKSIAAAASSSTTATFKGCAWQVCVCARARVGDVVSPSRTLLVVW